MFADLFTPEQITILTQIILIDLVLAGDNAIIIGMVASKFPLEQRKKIIFWGIGGAVILRIILTLLTAYLLQITGLRLLGGLLLLYIVYKLYVDVIKNSSKEEDIKVESIDITLSGVDTANVKLFLDYDYIDRRVLVRRAVIDNNYAIIGTPILVFDGRLDQPRLTEDCKTYEPKVGRPA